MDLVSGIVGLKQAQLTSQVQFAVAKKILDNDKMQGAAAIQLLRAASEGPAKAGDALVTAATGLGGEIDVYG